MKIVCKYCRNKADVDAQTSIYRICDKCVNKMFNEVKRKHLAALKRDTKGNN